MATYRNLAQIAEREKRPISDLIDHWVAQSVQLPPLPDDVAAELTALTQLSNHTLITLAQAIPQNQDEADHVLLRRAACLDILHQRGYALDNLITVPDNPCHY